MPRNLGADDRPGGGYTFTHPDGKPLSEEFGDLAYLEIPRHLIEKYITSTSDNVGDSIPIFCVLDDFNNRTSKTVQMSKIHHRIYASDSARKLVRNAFCEEVVHDWGPPHKNIAYKLIRVREDIYPGECPLVLMSVYYPKHPIHQFLPNLVFNGTFY